jgi:chromosome partitioning protein
MIISLVNRKGGVGKTTLTINLAASALRRNYSVIVIDADPQGSVLQWQTIEENSSFDVEHQPKPLLPSDIKRLSKTHDHILIDSPPVIGDIIQSVLAISDLAIVPVGPSPLDIWSSNETVSLIRRVQNQNHSLEARLLICRKISTTRIGREAREAMQVYNLDIFKTEICQRVAFIQSLVSGVSVLQYAPNSEASREIQSLCEEVFQ